MDIPKLTNARTYAVIDGWPFGRQQRCQAEFAIETTHRGERVRRRTSKPGSNPPMWNKPKRTTYATQCAICDGDDGKTWLVMHSRGWGQIHIKMGTFQHATTLFEGDHDDRYTKMLDLLNSRTDNRKEKSCPTVTEKA